MIEGVPQQSNASADTREGCVCAYPTASSLAGEEPLALRQTSPSLQDIHRVTIPVPRSAHVGRVARSLGLRLRIALTCVGVMIKALALEDWLT